MRADSDLWFWVLVALCVASLAVVWSLTFTLFQVAPRGHTEVSRLLQEPYDAERVQLAKGERVALNGEAAYQNGIYVFNGRTLERASDMCRNEQLFTGTHVYVRGLGEQVVLQVLPASGQNKWKGISKGIKFVTKKEHVFGKRRQNGLLRATKDGFVFDDREEFRSSELVLAGVQKFLVVPVSRDTKVGHTHVTLIGTHGLYWRATVFFDESHMRLAHLFPHDSVTVHLDEKPSPRGDSLHIDLLLDENDTITVHTITP